MGKITRCIAGMIMCLCISILAEGCGVLKKQAGEQDKFDEFLNHMFVTEVQSDTFTLNSCLAEPEKYGITDTEVTLGDYGIEQMGEDLSDTKKYLEGLQAFQYKLLTPDQQLTYDILSDYLQQSIDFQNKYIYFNECLGPSTGIQAQLPILLAEFNFYDKEDIDDYIKLLPCIYEYFEDIIQFEKDKSEMGLFMSDAVAKRIIEQCEAFIDRPEENFLIVYFNEKVSSYSGLTRAEAEDYQKRNKEAVLEYIIPAYQLLIDGLTELMGTGTNDAGLYYYPNGRAYYESYAKYLTGSDKSIQEMIGMLENAINNNMAKLTGISESDASLYMNFNAYPITDPQEIIDDLKHDIKKDFPEISSVDCEIKYVPEALSGYLSPAMYLAPPVDQCLDNDIYINGNDPETLSLIYPTVAHESYPGHLYQYVYFLSQNPAPIRSILPFKGYTEGWATYAGMYSYDTAGISVGLANIQEASYIVDMCLSARTDIGIHYEGWTQEEVSDYLADYINDEQACKNFYETILEEPAQYLPYTIGYLEIMKLRNKAERVLGGKFVPKDFNQFLLDIGPAPFGIIEDKADIWMKEIKH